MSEPTAGPWYASAKHPQTGHIVITNPQGRVIAIVPSAEDAFFICRAREAYSVQLPMQIDWRAFGLQVSTARKAKRHTQATAAELCGISRNYMSMIERGSARDPGYTIVLTLCMWLGLDMPKP